MLTQHDGRPDADDDTDLDAERSILSPIPFPSPPAITDPSVPDYRAPWWHSLRTPALVALGAAVAVTVGLAFRNRPDAPGTAVGGTVSAPVSTAVALDTGPSGALDTDGSGGIEPAPPSTAASSVGLAPPATAIADADDADDADGVDPASDPDGSGPAVTATPPADGPGEAPAASTTVATTTPTTTPGAAEPAPTTTLPPIIGVGGFELGPEAGPNGALRHGTDSTMGSWQVTKTVYREDVGLHARPPGSGHVLNIRRSGSVTRSVAGLVPGQRYQLVIRAAHHVDAPTVSVVVARVSVDGHTITIAPTTRSDEPFERFTLEFVAADSDATVTITGAQATEFCCGVVFDNLQIEPID
ncbi:MAG: hypothetical protein AAF467_20210 [Actinomycetota bacterium]